MITKNRKPWTSGDDAALLAAVARGERVPDIARALGRTPYAVYSRLSRKAAGLRTLRNQKRSGITVCEVARLFGVSKRCAMRWVQDGQLHARRNGTRKQPGTRRNAHFLISRQAILNFLSVRETWSTYDVERIASPNLRSIARLRRQEAHGHWEQFTEYQKARFYSNHDTAQCRDGKLPATLIRKRWYVWIDD